MQEQSQREEQLREEQLEWVTGASGNGSPSNHPGPGSYLTCQACQRTAHQYHNAIVLRDLNSRLVDGHVSQGNLRIADIFLQSAGETHQMAQNLYGEMAAHGHPDFPAAFAQQRQHYNPDA
jgi:hypothetical protein